MTQLHCSSHTQHRAGSALRGSHSPPCQPLGPSQTALCAGMFWEGSCQPCLAGPSITPDAPHHHRGMDLPQEKQNSLKPSLMTGGELLGREVEAESSCLSRLGSTCCLPARWSIWCLMLLRGRDVICRSWTTSGASLHAWEQMEALCCFLQLERQIGWDGGQKTPSLCSSSQGGESPCSCLSWALLPAHLGLKCSAPVPTGLAQGQGGQACSRERRVGWIMLRNASSLHHTQERQGRIVKPPAGMALWWGMEEGWLIRLGQFLPPSPAPHRAADMAGDLCASLGWGQQGQELCPLLRARSCCWCARALQQRWRAMLLVGRAAISAQTGQTLSGSRSWAPHVSPRSWDTAQGTDSNTCCQFHFPFLPVTQKGR